MKLNFKPFMFCLFTGLFISIRMHAQICNRTVNSFVAAPGGYTINGTALLEDVNGSLTLYFDNAFSTTSGPDLHVYLAANLSAPTTPGNNHMDLGSLISISGQQSYQLNPGVMISDFNYVLIHCNTFNHFWGGGMLGTINCPTAISENSSLELFQAYPNPSNGICNLSHVRPDMKLGIFDMQGRKVFKLDNVSDGRYDFTFLERGVYMLYLSNETKQLPLKIVIQ
jgi:hypothetical protein